MFYITNTILPAIHLWITSFAFVDFETLLVSRSADKYTNKCTPPTDYSIQSDNVHIALNNHSMFLRQPIMFCDSPLKETFILI